jgi:hypothetical protein
MIKPLYVLKRISDGNGNYKSDKVLAVCKIPIGVTTTSLSVLE